MSVGSPINLGFIYVLQGVPGRKVIPLVVAAYDEATGKQAIIGRRNNNEWMFRGDNPHATVSATLLTHLIQEFQDNPGSLSDFTAHILYAYDDWAPADDGKAGLTVNAYSSIDDGATWTAVSGWDGLIDAGTTGSEGAHYLRDGGATLVQKRGGILGTTNLAHVIPTARNFNRLGGTVGESDAGSVRTYHTWLYAEDGLHVLKWTRDAALDTNAPVSLGEVGFVAYPGAASRPWEGDKAWVSNSGSVTPGIASSYITLRPGPGEDLYWLNLGDLVASSVGWATLLAATATPTMDLSSYLTSGVTVTEKIGSFNGTRSFIGLSYNASPFGLATQIGLVDGGEAVWGGIPPVILASVGATNSAIYSLDPLNTGHILDTPETVRFDSLFLGALPGEGSDPAYTDKRLVAVQRHGTGVIDFLDESGLLDLGFDRYTVMARTALSQPLQTSGVHWWNKVP